MLALAALALACALAPAASASGGDISPRIVGGVSVTDIATRPYQVAVLPAGFLCGGVIIDATHVVTAAHCVVDNDLVVGSPVGSPRGLVVVAGASDLSDTSGATVIPARTLSIDDQYREDTNDHDVAIVELSSPLWAGPDPTIDGTNKIAPVHLVDDTTFDGLLIHAGTTPVTATVSGWGYDEPVTCHPNPPPPDEPFCDAPSDPGGFPATLQTVDVPLIDPTSCSNFFANPPFKLTITPTLFCAGDATNADENLNKDSCNGDSGGPLVIDSNQPPGTPNPPNDFVLAGLVDSGFGCAQKNLPGIYTRVSEPSVTAFIQSTDPRLIDAPTISGGAQVGQTVTCGSGNWTDNPSFMYRLYRDSVNGPVPITAQSTNSSITLPLAAGNRNVFCEVQAAAGHTLRTADSDEIAVAPIPGPPTPPVTPPVSRDSVAPSLRVASKKCTKTSCTVKVTVTDSGTPTSGVGKVKATLSYSKRVSCRKHGKRASCTKHVRRALKATGGAGGKFTIVAKRLAPGKGYTISLVPFDQAGNRSQFSTITNVRTKPRHTRGLV